MHYVRPFGGSIYFWKLMESQVSKVLCKARPEPLPWDRCGIYRASLQNHGSPVGAALYQITSLHLPYRSPESIPYFYVDIMLRDVQ